MRIKAQFAAKCVCKSAEIHGFPALLAWHDISEALGHDQTVQSENGRK